MRWGPVAAMQHNGYTTPCRSLSCRICIFRTLLYIYLLMTSPIFNTRTSEIHVYLTWSSNRKRNIFYAVLYCCQEKSSVLLERIICKATRNEYRQSFSNQRWAFNPKPPFPCRPCKRDIAGVGVQGTYPRRQIIQSRWTDFHEDYIPCRPTCVSHPVGMILQSSVYI